MQNPFKREPYPKNWDNPSETLFREFRFSDPDIQILMRLVNEHISDKGNSGYTKERLLGILRSMRDRPIYQTHHCRKLRYPFNIIKEELHFMKLKFQRLFNMGNYRKELNMLLILKEIEDEEKKLAP